MLLEVRPLGMGGGLPVLMLALVKVIVRLSSFREFGSNHICRQCGLFV